MDSISVIHRKVKFLLHKSPFIRLTTENARETWYICFNECSTLLKQKRWLKTLTMFILINKKCIKLFKIESERA